MACHHVALRYLFEMLSTQFQHRVIKLCLTAFFLFSVLSISIVAVVVADTIAAKSEKRKWNNRKKKITQIVSVPFASTFYRLKRTWKMQWKLKEREREKKISSTFITLTNAMGLFMKKIRYQKAISTLLTGLNKFKNTKTSFDRRF